MEIYLSNGGLALEEDPPPPQGLWKKVGSRRAARPSIVLFGDVFAPRPPSLSLVCTHTQTEVRTRARAHTNSRALRATLMVRSRTGVNVTRDAAGLIAH